MHIRSFLVGFLLAASLSIGVGVWASGKPRVVGDSGNLDGVEVQNVEGKTICMDPFYVKDTETISCE